MRPRIIIIGAGYAGVAAARAARHPDVDVVILDATGRHEFLPRLAAVAGGSAAPGDGWAPAGTLVTDAEIVVATADHLATATHEVVLREGEPVAYDAAVITVGADPSKPAIPGLADHAVVLKGVPDALALRGRIAAAQRLVVVGAGATGTQLAGEAQGAHPDLEVVLVEADARILPAFDEALGTEATRQLQGRGVTVRTGVRLVAVDAQGARLSDGSREDGLVVWAGGFAARGHALLPGSPDVDGRLVVDANLQVPDAGPVFAAGDAAATRDAEGKVMAMSAQAAVQGGAIAGRNAMRVARGVPPEPGHIHHRGWVVPLGDGRGVADLVGVHFTGLMSRLVPALHEAVDAKHLTEAGGIGALTAHRRGAHQPDDEVVATVAAEAATPTAAASGD